MNPHLTGWAWACGLALLIPVPWLDEYVERRFTRRLLAEVAARRGTPLGPEALDVLTEDRDNSAVGCLVALVKWPLKKLFRTVLYFLTIKDVIDGVTRAAHRATLVDIAFAEGFLPGRADRVRVAMDALMGKIRISPVSRFLWRQERPDLPGPPAPTLAAQVVWFLQRQGGGGLLIPRFHERLRADEAG